MSRSYANPEVLSFYQQLPFNYFGDTSAAAAAIRRTDAIAYYPVLPPLLAQGIRALDVGCGAGWFVNGVNYHYHKHGSSAAGVDFNAVAINQAREVATLLGVRSEFQESDLFGFQAREPYSLVTSFGVLHHTDDCLAGLRHIFRDLVRPGGYAFIGLYHTYGRKPFLDHFDKLKKNGLSKEELQREFMELRSGSGDKIHDLSWFYDQVLHPHETQHSLEEILPVLHAEGMELKATSINRFESFDREEDLIEREKSYYPLALQRLKDKFYFPGFFLFLARKTGAP